MLAFACAFAAPASGMSEGSELSPRLVELARPSVMALPPAQQAKELEVAASGPGSLLREGDRVLVDVSFERGAIAGLDALKAAGARVVAASRRYQTVTVAISPASLHALPGVAGVDAVSEDRAPLLYGTGESPSTGAIGAECEGGSVISEGIAQLRVDDARGKYHVDGSGVTVGVLSDSYNQASAAATHAGEDVTSEDLPGFASGCSGQKTPVSVLEDLAPSSSYQPTDEGRAMLQIVHDVAPAASLAFATAFKSEVSFAGNIDDLAKAGADVIVDDVVYFSEPFFQDGPVAVAVDKAAGEGVTYFSSAGNDNLLDASKPANEIASWETPLFREEGACSAVVQQESGTAHCLDFKPGAGGDTEFGLTVSAGKTLTVDLQWAEPWNGVKADLDTFLLDQGGKLLASSHEDNVGSTQKPVEVLQWKNPAAASAEVRLAVTRCFAACNPGADPTKVPRVKFALLQNGSGVTKTGYPKSAEGDVVGPTIFGHTAAAGAVSVAAVPFNNSAKPEEFSSRGPATHYFGPVTGPGAAAPLPAAEIIDKPNVAATDCGATTFFARFFANEAAWRFCGTSAAAPHAAGVAALELDAKPLASVAEVRGAQESTAASVGAFDKNAVGKGLVDADAAILSLLPPSTVAITGHPPNRTNETNPTFEFTPTPAAKCLVQDKGVPANVQETVPCESPYSVATPLTDGEYEFTVEAVGGDKASFSFTVDTAPPTITFAPPPAKFTADLTPTFAFSASEPAGFACSLDGGALQACVSPFTVASPLPDGSHTLKVTGTDQVGNEGEAEMAFVIDTVAPKVTITGKPQEKTTDDTPAFEFTATEPSSFTCSIDGASPQFCSTPFVAPPLSDGAHSFRITATDPAGNAGGASATFTLTGTTPKPSSPSIPARHPYPEAQSPGHLPLWLQRGGRDFHLQSRPRPSAHLRLHRHAPLRRGQALRAGQSPRRGGQLRSDPGRLSLSGQAGSLTLRGCSRPPGAALSGGPRAAGRGGRPRCRAPMDR